jgi:hypothetical protein
MADKFTLSQIDAKPTDYTILDTDLLLMTTGTNTPFLSSMKVSVAQLSGYVTGTGTTATLTVSAATGSGAASKVLTIQNGLVVNIA